MYTLSRKFDERLREKYKMQQNIQQKSPRLLGGIVTFLLYAVCTSGAQAGDYRFGYPYRNHYPYDNYGLHDNFGLRQDMSRLTDQMQRQQRELAKQVYQQQEQSRLLRQQQSAQHRFTAKQACYYRFNGGLDLCEGFFDVASKEYAACFEKAVELNSGCAGDIAKPAFSSGD